MADRRNPLVDLQPVLLAKLGSIIGHVEELRSPDGDEQFDGGAIDALLRDPQIQCWLSDMRSLALVPLPRRRRHG